MPLDALLDRQLLIISGKGGVGKTTVAAAVSVLVSRYNKRVLVCEVEGKRALSSLFGSDELTPTPRELRPNLYGMNISAEESLKEYFDVQFHMKRLAKPLVASQLVYYVTHAAPGLRDLLMLGKVWHEAVRKRSFDVIVLDTPAAGHAVSMLRSPAGFLQAVPLGPMARNARQVVEWLQDPQKVSILLVSMAEEMPVNESIETTHLLEEKLGMDVTATFINMLYPPLYEDAGSEKKFRTLASSSQLLEEAKKVKAQLNSTSAKALFEAGNFYLDRRDLQQEHRKTLVAAMKDTSRIVDLPFMFRESFGDEEIDDLAKVMEDQLAL